MNFDQVLIKVSLTYYIKYLQDAHEYNIISLNFKNRNDDFCNNTCNWDKVLCKLSKYKTVQI